MREDPDPPPLDVPAIRARRESLRRAITRIEVVLSRPGQDRHQAWAGEVGSAVDVLADVWETHVALTEAPDGLLAQIVNEAPRLASTVGRLRREHLQIAARLRTTGEQLDSADESGLAVIRADLAGLLIKINGHRRDGGELIHQAYQVDIGGE